MVFSLEPNRKSGLTADAQAGHIDILHLGIDIIFYGWRCENRRSHKSECGGVRGFVFPIVYHGRNSKDAMI